MCYDLELFGKKVCKIRNNLNYTQKDVSELSTLTIETLRKIENGKILPRHITLELLSSALKKDLNQLILNYRISEHKEFYEIRDIIENNLESGHYDNLNFELNRLKIILETINDNNYMHKLVKQLIYLVDSVILNIKYKDYDNSLIKLSDAMRETTPQFDIRKYNEFVYSSMEVRILMNIALLLNRRGSKEHSLEVLKFCLDVICPDEIELKIKILYNLAYSYHRNDISEKALYYANEGIRICIENNKLNSLGLLYSRKGVAEYFLNDNNYNNSFRRAEAIFDITGQDNLKGMLIKFYKKHNIEISSV